jgi:hypothetical protein
MQQKADNPKVQEIVDVLVKAKNGISNEEIIGLRRKVRKLSSKELFDSKIISLVNKYSGIATKECNKAINAGNKKLTASTLEVSQCWTALLEVILGIIADDSPARSMRKKRTSKN